MSEYDPAAMTMLFEGRAVDGDFFYYPARSARCMLPSPGDPPYFCTRRAGHDGPHVAHGVTPVLAAWDLVEQVPNNEGESNG